MKYFFVLLFAIVSFSAFSLDKYCSVNTEVPFIFEYSEYYDNTQVTSINGMGIGVNNRLLFTDNLGMNFNISANFMISTSTIITEPEPEILDAHYFFPPGIFMAGIGFTYKNDKFFLDFGPAIHYFHLVNTLADYRNISIGFFINPAYVISLSTIGFEVGIKAGYDFYSVSNTELKIENRNIEYDGGYSLPYIVLYFGVNFNIKK